MAMKQDSTMLLIAIVSAVSGLAVLSIVMLGGVHQAYAPSPPSCVECITEIHGNGTGTITIPESAEIGPSSCIECEAEIFFDATVFEETGGVLGKLTLEYIDEEGAEQTTDTSIRKAKITQKAFLLKSIDGAPCDACEQFRFSLVGKVGGKQAAMTLDGNYGIEGRFIGEVTISTRTA